MALPEQIQQILSEDSDERQKTTLEIASSHKDVEGQLAPRLYAEWHIRTNAGTSAGGIKGTGFSTWLKRYESKISRKTAYRLVREYADEWKLPKPLARSSGNTRKSVQAAPALLPGKQGSAPPQDDMGDAEFIPAPTSQKDMEEIILRFIRETDDVTLQQWWKQMSELVEAEISARRKAAENNVDAA